MIVPLTCPASEFQVTRSPNLNVFFMQGRLGLSSRNQLHAGLQIPVNDSLCQLPAIAGRSQPRPLPQASTSRFPSSTCPNRVRTGCLAGPRSTAPEVTSNWLPWQLHVTVVSSSVPFPREHPMWVQVSSKAYRCPSTLATLTLVPATSKTRICPATTSFERSSRTSVSLPPIARA